jgi:hypothetical protein
VNAPSPLFPFQLQQTVESSLSSKYDGLSTILVSQGKLSELDYILNSFDADSVRRKATNHDSMSGKSDDQKARESFASILSYYQQNQQSIENLPDWVQRPESSSISMGLAVGTVPSNEQTEELKADLKDLLSTQEAINKLSSSEKQLMIAAANSSKARRKDEN